MCITAFTQQQHNNTVLSYNLTNMHAYTQESILHNCTRSKRIKINTREKNKVSSVLLNATFIRTNTTLHSHPHALFFPSLLRDHTQKHIRTETYTSIRLQIHISTHVHTLTPHALLCVMFTNTHINTHTHTHTHTHTRTLTHT